MTSELIETDIWTAPTATSMALLFTMMKTTVQLLVTNLRTNMTIFVIFDSIRTANCRTRVPTTAHLFFTLASTFGNRSVQEIFTTNNSNIVTSANAVNFDYDFTWRTLTLVANFRA